MKKIILALTLLATTFTTSALRNTNPDAYQGPMFSKNYYQYPDAFEVACQQMAPEIFHIVFFVDAGNIQGHDVMTHGALYGLICPFIITYGEENTTMFYDGKTLKFTFHDPRPNYAVEFTFEKLENSSVHLTLTQFSDYTNLKNGGAETVEAYNEILRIRAIYVQNAWDYLEKRKK